MYEQYDSIKHLVHIFVLLELVWFWTGNAEICKVKFSPNIKKVQPKHSFIQIILAQSTFE